MHSFVSLFHQYDVFESHPRCCVYKWFPLYCWTLLCCKDIPHFIHLPVGKLLDYFQFGAIMNKTAMNHYV